MTRETDLFDSFKHIGTLIQVHGIILTDVLVRDGKLHILHWLDRDPHGGDVYLLFPVLRQSLARYLSDEITYKELLSNEAGELYFANDDGFIKWFHSGSTNDLVPPDCQPSDDSWYSTIKEWTPTEDVARIEYACGLSWIAGKRDTIGHHEN